VHWDKSFYLSETQVLHTVDVLVKVSKAFSGADAIILQIRMSIIVLQLPEIPETRSKERLGNCEV
jgi:hypothetical protein